MAIEFSALRIDALDPLRLADFWARVLRWDVHDSPVGDVLVAPGDATSYPLRFGRTDRRKTIQNRIHLDLTSDSPGHQRELVDRVLALGGRHVDVGQRGDEGHVVLADPEGNELCVVEAGNGFLAGCGRIGAINCDGTQALGYFWSEALGWPLVWDQDEETAIQSPRGGSKITWSGPPLMARNGKDRVQLDVAVPADDDVEAELQRLVALGATPADGLDTDDEVTMLDPDGNQFAVLTAAVTPRSS
ncbi:VOC family protein [Angustibacter sp. Root456]|uniref:VOC family protein n=1 Tax=Angustibacter sp. Root456 TaxID=1736539 RepID=UPI0006F7AF45|nr:glyoxalase/bleomycin resistance/extradiol dioxygenase family protein [Angustibacter sp. Root456]KQX66498.1 bleomycin resistance protein [Angustibacter sp. Root456]